MGPILFILLAVLAPTSYCRVVDIVAQPLITPPPRVDIRQASSNPATAPMNALSLAQVLVTAVPESLRQLAETNLPAASSALWSEFLDGSIPSWFTGLPTDVQTYLVEQFAPSTTQPSTNPSTAISSSPSLDSAAAAAVITAYVTTTVGAQPSAAASSGLSTAGIVGIGLGVPLALLAIAVLILACCLARAVRRNRKHAVHHVDSRPPTPAFLSSTMVPRPTTSVRGGNGSRTSVHDDPFEDPPAAAVGARRSEHDSHRSSGPLLAVPEADNEHEHEAHRALPAQSHMRRSRGSIVDDKDLYTNTSVRSEPDGIYGNHHAYSPVTPGNHAYGSPDWQNQHPAFRGGFPVKSHGSSGVTPSNIPRKPVAVPAQNRGGNLGHQFDVNSGPGLAGDAMLPGSQTRYSPPRQSDWPLSPSDNNYGNNYWRVHKPNHDRYERTYDSCR